MTPLKAAAPALLSVVIPPLLTVDLESIIISDDSSKISSYIQAKPTRLTEPDSDGKSLLIWLVSEDAIDCIQKILTTFDVQVNYQDKAGRSALHYAFAMQKIEIIKILLAAGANPFIKDYDGWSCLHYAIYHKSIELLDLIEHSPSMKIQSAKLQTKEANLLDELFREGSFTPLHLAARSSYAIFSRVERMARHFLDRKDELGMTVLHHLMFSPDTVANIRHCSEDTLHRYVNSVDTMGQTPLNIASQLGKWGEANMLLGKSTNPNLGWPHPLVYAIVNKTTQESGQNVMLHIQKLLEVKANPNATVGGDYTVLDLAKALDETKIVEMLLKAGAKKTQAFEAMEKYEKSKRVSIFKMFQTFSVGKFTEKELQEKRHLAETMSHDGTKELHELVTKDINFEQLFKYTTITELEYQNSQGETPFLYCCKKAGVQNCLALLALGIKHNAKDRYGNNALHIALQNDNLLVAYILIKRFPELINQKNTVGQTALHIAAKNGLHIAVELLVKHGADASILDSTTNNSVFHHLIDACDSEEKERQFLPLLNRLVTEKKELNSINGQGDTPLIYAWMKARMVVFQRLIELGADTEIKDRSDKTILMKVAQSGNTSQARLLITSGADRNALGSSTPLISAIMSANCEMVELLFDKTISTSRKKAPIANPNLILEKTESVFSSPLTAAVQKLFDIIIAKKIADAQLEAVSEFVIFKRVLDEGAQLDKAVPVLGKKHATALTLCSEYNLPLLVKILLSRGAKPDVRPKKNKPAIRLALKNDFVAVVKELLLANAKVKDTYIQDKSLSDEVRRLLREHKKRSESSLAALSRQPSIENLKNLFIKKTTRTTASASGSDSEKSQASAKNIKTPRLGSVPTTPRASNAGNLVPLDPVALSSQLSRIALTPRSAPKEAKMGPPI